MGIANFPTVLQPIIQQGFLERQFRNPLTAKLGFRSIADREDIPTGVGETITKTRAGLIPVNETPLVVANNTNFDNGMTPTGWGVEQYTLNMKPYGITLDLNTQQNAVGLANQFVRNAFNLGENANRTLDTLARNALYASYIGGNTRVRVALGGAQTTLQVDDIRGFQMTWGSNGVPIVVSAGNPVNCVIGSNTYACIGAVADVANVSTAPKGISGVLTFSTNVLQADGPLAGPVVAANAPMVLRPNVSGVVRATTAALVAGDTMQMVEQIILAASIMRDNGVPDIEGYYHWYGDNITIKGLFKDPEFQLLFRGAYGAKEYKQGTIFEIGGIKFIPTNMAPQQRLGTLNIRRAIICGQGALVEGKFAGMMQQETEDNLHLKTEVDGIAMITREPMDRFGEIIAQSWKWTGDYTVPTDFTTTSATIPTANSSAYKRAIVLESL